MTRALARRWRGWILRFRLLPRGSRIACSTTCLLDRDSQCRFGRRVVVREHGSILLAGSSQWTIGDHTWIMQGCEVAVTGGGRLSIGQNVYLGAYCNLRCCGRIEIGDHVRLGQFVSLIDANYDLRRQTGGVGDLVPESVRIEAGAWIGAQAVILPAVTVGEGAVIGAGSVVTRAVPPYAVVAGNPGRVLHYRQ